MTRTVENLDLDSSAHQEMPGIRSKRWPATARATGCPIRDDETPAAPSGRHEVPLIGERAATRGNLEYRIRHLLSATTSSAPLRTEAAPLAVAETGHIWEPPAKMRSCLIVMSDASRQSRARSSSAKSSLSFRA